MCEHLDATFTGVRINHHQGMFLQHVLTYSAVPDSAESTSQAKFLNHQQLSGCAVFSCLHTVESFSFQFSFLSFGSKKSPQKANWRV
jgi:hypothetical protein